MKSNEDHLMSMFLVVGSVSQAARGSGNRHRVSASTLGSHRHKGDYQGTPSSFVRDQTGFVQLVDENNQVENNTHHTLASDSRERKLSDKPF